MSTTDLPPAPPPPPPSGTPGPAGPSGEGPRVSRDDRLNLGRIRRTVDGSPYGHHIAGVAGGVARHLDVDPVVVRVILAVLACFGPGVLIYLAMWALVPTEDGRPALIRMDDASRNLVLWIGGSFAASALLASTLAPWHNHPVWWWGFGPWPWLLVVVFIAIPAWRRRSRPSAQDWLPDAPQSTGTTPEGTPTGAAADDTAVAPTYAPTYAYAPPPATAYVPRPKPPRAGPVLFWPTLAIIALAEGILGMVDVAGGLDVVPAAYPALAVSIVAIALVVGAFWGRAGGLIAVGILGVLATLGATAGHEVGWGGEATDTPRTAAAVADTYDRMGIGHYTLDLTQLRDPQLMDGRTVHVDGHIGNLEIDVPSDWGVVFNGDVHGAGQIATSDSDQVGRGGTDTTYSHTWPAASGEPTVTIDADLRFGLIDLRRIP